MGRARVLAVLPPAAPGLAPVAQAVRVAWWRQTVQFSSAPLQVGEGRYIWANDTVARIS